MSLLIVLASPVREVRTRFQSVRKHLWDSAPQSRSSDSKVRLVYDKLFIDDGRVTLHWRNRQPHAASPVEVLRQLVKWPTEKVSSRPTWLVDARHHSRKSWSVVVRSSWAQPRCSSYNRNMSLRRNFRFPKAPPGYIIVRRDWSARSGDIALVLRVRFVCRVLEKLLKRRVMFEEKKIPSAIELASVLCLEPLATAFRKFIQICGKHIVKKCNTNWATKAGVIRTSWWRFLRK